MTDQERILKIIEWSKLSPNAFAKHIGYQKGQSIYGIRHGLRPMNFKIATKISQTYPEINKTWILTGDGEMLLKKNEDFITEETQELEKSEVIYLQAEIVKLLEQNRDLIIQVKDLMRLQAINTETINFLVRKDHMQTEKVVDTG